MDSIPIAGSRRRKRRDELRLHTAQAHAAVSVAQLAAAIAGVVSACELRSSSGGAGADRKLSTVLASAAALVATVCAESAESAGANRSRVTSAVKAGLDSRSPAELLTLTATAATCNQHFSGETQPSDRSYKLTDAMMLSFLYAFSRSERSSCAEAESRRQQRDQQQHQQLHDDDEHQYS